MATTLSLYLQLEATMVALDDLCRTAQADSLRDTMDLVWLDLSEAELAFLSGRDDLIIAPVAVTRAEAPSQYLDVWKAA